MSAVVWHVGTFAKGSTMMMGGDVAKTRNALSTPFWRGQEGKGSAMMTGGDVAILSIEEAQHNKGANEPGGVIGACLPAATAKLSPGSPTTPETGDPEHLICNNAAAAAWSSNCVWICSGMGGGRQLVLELGCGCGWVCEETRNVDEDGWWFGSSWVGVKIHLSGDGIWDGSTLRQSRPQR
ncbi:hypothetical protein BU17DRAFT_68116 [Hysterangium stoloniferum]|nr:hypothetical protein BU17DRAFT_68116 [Hysterangium stoloniferum]